MTCFNCLSVMVCSSLIPGSALLVVWILPLCSDYSKSFIDNKLHNFQAEKQVYLLLFSTVTRQDEVEEFTGVIFNEAYQVVKLTLVSVVLNFLDAQHIANT